MNKSDRIFVPGLILAWIGIALMLCGVGFWWIIWAIGAFMLLTIILPILWLQIKAAYYWYDNTEK